MDTDIRLAVTRNLRETFAKHPELKISPSVGEIWKLLESQTEAFDPRAFLSPIMDTVMYGDIPDEDVNEICRCIEAGVKEVVGTLIVRFDSVGKAPKVKPATLEEMAEWYKKVRK